MWKGIFGEFLSFHVDPVHFAAPVIYLHDRSLDVRRLQFAPPTSSASLKAGYEVATNYSQPIRMEHKPAVPIAHGRHISVVVDGGLSPQESTTTDSPQSVLALLKESENEEKNSVWQKHQFTVIVTVVQVIFLILMGTLGRYSKEASPGGEANMTEFSTLYPMFQDVHVMIFAGFGFLMTFLKRYGYSAVSLNLLLASMVIQWGIIVRGLIYESRHEPRHRFSISLEALLDGDFSAATVLITMGALLGKLSPAQYMVMAFLEVPAATGIGYIASEILKINDVGDSITIHLFGAYFGMACTTVFVRKAQGDHKHEGSSYSSDIFSMIGTIFLWCYWPSFNAGTAEPHDAKIRAVANTYLALAASTVATFVFSQLTDPHKKFDMMHIANATLAGGVAIGTNANVALDPFDAMITGVVAGLVSTLGFRYLTPLLSRFGIHDTCGVHNLHGMPAIISAVSSCIFAVRYDAEEYGEGLSVLYPAVGKRADGTFNMSAVSLNQLYGSLIVLGGALITGAITGAILRLPIWNQVDDEENFSDNQFFETPAEFKENL